MNLKRRVATTIVVQLAGRAVTMLLGLAVVGGLTRYLGVAGYGRYTTVFAYANFLAVIADFGFFNVMVRELSLEKRPAHDVVSNVLALRTVFAAAVFALGTVVAIFLGYGREIQIGIGVASLSLFFTTLSMTLAGLFQVEMRMGRAVVSDVAGKAATAFLIFIMIFAHQSLVVILAAYIIGNALTFGSNVLFARRSVQLSLRFDSRYWGYLLPQAVTVGLFTVVAFIYFHVDMVILSLLKGDFDIGIYGAAYKLIDLSLVFAGIFAGAVLPVITRRLTIDREALGAVIQRAFDILMLVSGLVIAVVLAEASGIIRFVAGSAFVTAAAPGLMIFGHPATAAVVLQILILAVGFSYATHLLNAIVLALGQQRRLIIPGVIVTIVNVVLNFVLIPHFSYLAAAVNTILSEVLIILYPIIVIRQAKVALPSLRIVPRLLFAGTLAFVVGWFMRPYGLWIGLVSVTVSYVLTAIAIGGLSRGVLAEALAYIPGRSE